MPVESWRMTTEIALALVALPAIVVGRLTGSVAALTAAILVILAGQLIAIWHQFNRRTDRIAPSPVSRAAKVLILAALGICILVAGDSRG